MRYGTIAKVNPDSTVDVSFGDEPERNLSTAYGYQPVMLEQVVVADVDGELVVCFAVYNRPSDLDNGEVKQ